MRIAGLRLKRSAARLPRLQSVRHLSGLSGIVRNAYFKATLGGLFLLIILSFFCSGSEAATDQWRYIGANEKGERLFYDTSGVLHFSRDEVQVWVREISHEPVRKLKEINCAHMTVRDRQIISDSGKALRPVRLPSRWQPVEQDALMKELYKVLCR
jgi:hypothetical protein